MNEKMKQLETKLKEDAEFAKELFVLETPEEARELLQTNGIEFSLSEVVELGKAVQEVTRKREEGQLTDEELEEIAGGNDIEFAIVKGMVLLTYAAYSVFFKGEVRW